MRESAAGAERRAAVAALAVSGRDRLRWCHLLVLAPALVVLALSGLGVAGSISASAARLVGVGRHGLRDALPALAAAYVGAALLAALAWARFDVRRAALRLPAVLVFGAAGIVVVVAASWLGGIDSGRGEGSGAGGGASARRMQKDRSDEEPQVLASALVDRDEAAAMLGVPVGHPTMRGRTMMPGLSACRYRALDRSTTLTVMVQEVRRSASAERLLRKGDPLLELGDRAAAVAGGVWVLTGDWMLALMVRRRDGLPGDRPALVEGARRAVNLLPPAARSRTGSRAQHF